MFGDKLKELRINRQLSQDGLGEILGTSGKNVSSWERGIARPDIDTLKVMAEFFNVSSDYLLSIQEKEEIERIRCLFNELGLEFPDDMTLEDLQKVLKMMAFMKGDK